MRLPRHQFESPDTTQTLAEGLVYRKLPFSGSLVALVVSPFLIVRTAWRCMGQSERWPWVQFEEYLDVSLREVRTQYRIKVARDQSAA